MRLTESARPARASQRGTVERHAPNHKGQKPERNTITVYTGNDVNSKQVLYQLQMRQLTFREVRVDLESPREQQQTQQQTQQQNQLQQLPPFVPQIWFGNRPVAMGGNVRDGLTRELERLDRRRRVEPNRMRRSEGGKSLMRKPEQEGGLASIGEDKDNRRSSKSLEDAPDSTQRLNSKDMKKEDKIETTLSPDWHYVLGQVVAPHKLSFDTNNSSTHNGLSVHGVVQVLRAWGISRDERVEGVLYKKAFYGQALLDQLSQPSHAASLFQHQEANSSELHQVPAPHEMAQLLLKQQFLRRVALVISEDDEGAEQQEQQHEEEQHVLDEIDFDPKALYRLQCYQTPHILNSYCIWNPRPQEQTSQETTAASTVQLIEHLLRCLNNLELSSVLAPDPSVTKDKDQHDNSSNNKVGLMDYQCILSHANFGVLEEALCQLQEVVLPNPSNDDDDDHTKNQFLALGLNVYHLMLRYAFVKIGIPLSEQDRQDMLQKVKFDLGGTLYSFQEWRAKLFEISGSDPRIYLALQTGLSGGATLSLPFVCFSADQLDPQLEVAAQVFLADPSHVRVVSPSQSTRYRTSQRIPANSQATGPEIQLSNVFQYHKSNFGDGSTRAILEFVLQYHVSINSKSATKPSDLAALYDSFAAGNLDSEDKKQQGLTLTYTDPIMGQQVSRAWWYNREIPILSTWEKGSLRAERRKFQPPTLSPNERGRLATLRGLNVLDTYAEEERFDRITRKVAKQFDIPLVLVSLVDRDRQWFKSTVWNVDHPPAPETPRDISFCGHAILQPPKASLPKNHAGNELFVVPNALEDERFADNPLVTGPLGIRFYAACTLRVPTLSDDGEEVPGASENVGTLCLIDQKPRDCLTAKEESQLRRFAELVQFELSNPEDSDVEGEGEDDTSSGLDEHEGVSDQ